MDYDKIANGYDELYGEEQLRKAEIISKNIKVKKNDKLLDIGCGTGIASSAFDCEKIGIDSSVELLKQASMPVVEGNAEQLPFNDEEFDIIICVTAIHNFSDPEKAINEMDRVVKNDGKIIITLLKKSAKFNNIDELIRKKLKVKKIIMEEKDAIYFCEKK